MATVGGGGEDKIPCGISWFKQKFSSNNAVVRSIL